MSSIYTLTALSKQYINFTDRVDITGNLLIATTTDNGIDKLQVNGTASGSPATLSNQFVTKSQLDSVVRSYKVYTALIAQSGTSNPTVKILENTLGGSIVWTRDIAGSYLGTLTGAFIANKTFLLLTSYSAYNTEVKATWLDGNRIQLGTFNSSGTQADGIMVGDQNIEIRVYN